MRNLYYNPISKFLAYRGLQSHKMAGSNNPYVGYSTIPSIYLKYFKLFIATKIKFIRQELRLSETAKLKNSKSGRKCLIIANGPSKRLLDYEGLSQIRQQRWDIFGLNQFHLDDNIAHLVNMYVCSDPDTLKRHPPGSYLSQKTQGLTESLIKYKPSIFHAHLIPVQHLSEAGLKCYPFNDNYNPFSSNHSPLKPRGYASVTFLKAVAIAEFLGYDNIYIIGADYNYSHNTWLLPGDEIMILNDSSDASASLLFQTPIWQDASDFFFVNFLLLNSCRLFSNSSVINLYPLSGLPYINKLTDIPPDLLVLFNEEAIAILTELYSYINELCSDL